MSQTLYSTTCITLLHLTGDKLIIDLPSLYVYCYWATVCKTVRPLLVSVLSVCNVGVLWPNGWMD